ncbi:hypothetical protein BpHYR1_028334 [Brachionus plicatilis]|uniref:Uncharacterized protein n=1 Tax=Brachionus plicatilis TaxID=10195 RepID=A0A3M7R3Q6_BRAPC|nr:hypothetical protein BpHYR1_028334 [Brachionus plicatilis]
MFASSSPVILISSFRFVRSYHGFSLKYESMSMKFLLFSDEPLASTRSCGGVLLGKVENVLNGIAI